MATVIEEPAKLEHEDIAIRIHNIDTGDYAVEYSPIERNGTIKGVWDTIGGPLGFADSTFSTEEEAREFFEDLHNLPESTIAKKYPDIWEASQ